MKKSVVTIASCIALIFAIFGCATSAGNGAERTALSWTGLQTLEQSFVTFNYKNRFADEQPHEFKLRTAKLLKEMKKYVLLEAGGKTYQATSLYFATALSSRSKYELYSMNFADDTIHTTEMLNPIVVVPARRQPLSLWIAPGGVPQLLMIGTGDPGEMHVSGYKNIHVLERKSHGILPIDLSAEHGPQLLFVLIRCKGDRYIKKYVWVLD